MTDSPMGRRAAVEPMLRVAGVSCDLGGRAVLQRVSFTVGASQIAVVLGPNGAGKSTLVDVIAGQLRPSQGTVALAGADVTAVDSCRLTHAGIARTFQVPRPLQGCTVWENVFVAAAHGRGRTRNRHATRQRTTAAVERVGLASHADELAGRLPQAWLRKLDLARALALDPVLLLLDEPMAGLDAPDVDDTVELLLQLRDEGVTIVAVEHVMRAVLAVADIAVFLHRGEVLRRGTPEQVLADEQVMDAYLGAPRGWGAR